MSIPSPYVSLALICGDAGIKTLPRLLTSILCRSDGSSMVGEVIIGWNGQDEAAFTKALPFRDEAGAFHPAKKGEPVVPIRIIQQPWWLKNGADFAKARNETFAACTGEWVLWADTDDIISSSDDSGPDGLSAINAVLRTYGRPEDVPGDGPSPTFADSLRQLPYNVNVVLAPYDYLVDEATHAAVVRQVMRRVVRRSAGFIWRNPIHEVLYPAGSTPMVSILATSLLVRHYPSESEQARLKRNSEIVQRMESAVPLEYADARHAYDVATAKIGMGDLAGADQAICFAIGRSAQSPEDGYRYRITRATLAIQRGLIDTVALQEAFFAIACMPQKPEAYFIASECLYLLGRWDACVKFYKMGKSFPYTPDPIDFVASRVIRPAAQAALALLELNQPEQAIEEVGLALREFPADPMALNVKMRAMEDLARKRAIDGVLEAAQYLMAKKDEGAGWLLETIEGCVSLRGITTLPLFQELAAAPIAVPFERVPETEEELAFAQVQPNGVKSLVDVGTTDLLREIEMGGMPVYNAQRTKEGHLLVARDCRTAEKEHIAFYCPHGYVPWDPLYVEKHALGGSETSAIYLAYELAQRGYRVTFYCPGGGLLPQVKNGVVWYGINAFDPAKLEADVLIAHRSPFILRNPDLHVPTLVWHQDNGYASRWQWSPEVHAKSKGSLHVSEWAKVGLVKELEQYGSVDSLPAHYVIGNGIRKEWCACERGELPERIRKHVIYASDPSRGLDTLLNCWPHVLAVHPDAELHLYVAWDCALSVIGDMATMGVPQVGALGTMRQKVAQLKNVINHGRVPQHELTEAMLRADVYAYPGGMMPEGFGVALVQAAAAGMRLVVPDEGALPEVLGENGSLVRYVTPVKSEEAAKEFLDALCEMLGTGAGNNDARWGRSLAIRSRHAYNTVTDRFIEALRKEGLVR